MMPSVSVHVRYAAATTLLPDGAVLNQRCAGVAMIALVSLSCRFGLQGQAKLRAESNSISAKRSGEPLGQIRRQGGETVGIGGNIDRRR